VRRHGYESLSLTCSIFRWWFSPKKELENHKLEDAVKQLTADAKASLGSGHVRVRKVARAFCDKNCVMQAQSHFRALLLNKPTLTFKFNHRFLVRNFTNFTITVFRTVFLTRSMSLWCATQQRSSKKERSPTALMRFSSSS